MGVRKHFTCPECGYEAEVSGGGDAGIEVVTQTVVCYSCSELMDLVVARRNRSAEDWTDAFEEMESDGLPPCKHCGSKNVEAWDEPYRCPKCGTSMEEGQTRALWD